MPRSDATIHPVLDSIGKAHGHSAAGVAIRWQLQRGVAVIPKSTSASRLQANFDTLGFNLSDVEMAQIDQLDQGLRLGWGGPKRDGKPPRDAVHPLYPFGWA